MNLSTFTWQLYRDSVAGQAAIQRSVLEFVVASSGSSDDEAPFDRGLWMARPGDDEGKLEIVGMQGVNLQAHVARLRRRSAHVQDLGRTPFPR